MADKVFRLRLKNPRSSEIRQVSVAAGSREEAVAIVMAQEAKRVAFVADPAQLAQFEADLKAGTLSPPDRARLLAHHQERAYALEKASK